MNLVSKKSVMSQIIGVFILVLVISILSGMVFLFTSSFKSSVYTASPLQTITVVNETGWINETGYTLAQSNALGFRSPSVILAINGTSSLAIPATNYTLTDAGVISNSSASPTRWNSVKITYSYVSIDRKSYDGINGTEIAGSQVINYLPILFLALIFGVILAVVLRIILPYINLGNNMGGEI